MPPTPPTLPFGPYQNLTVAEVAILDPAYLAALVRAELGPPELRAAAAKALLEPQPQSLPAVMGAAAADPIPAPHRRALHWVLGLGVAGAVALGMLDALGGLPGFTPSQAAGAPTVAPPAAPATSAPTRIGRPHATAAGGSAATSSALGTLQPVSRAAAALGQLSTAAAPDGAASACAGRVPGAVTAEQAAGLVDTFQAVAFDVVGTKDTGKVTFLNSHQPYQNHFYVAVFPTLYDQFPAPPAQYFKGKCVVVQGQVALYRGTPQMVLQTVDDIRVVGGP